MSADPMTPMVKQYLRIKAIYNDAILMYRVGDFYEMFFEDAEIASKLLDITLTSRNKNEANPIPLCGVPYHSVEPYIAKLLSLGRKVAICDQVEDPKDAKGVVKREVTRVITPGIILDGEGVAAGSHNFLAAISVGHCEESRAKSRDDEAIPRSSRDRHVPAIEAVAGPRDDKNVFGLAMADVSTGYFSAAQFNTLELLTEEIGRLEVREILLPHSLAKDLPLCKGESEGVGLPSLSLPYKGREGTGILVTPLDERHFDSHAISHLEGAAHIIHSLPAAASAAGAIWHYVKETQKSEPRHIRSIETRSSSNTMRLDETTKRNLELFRTMMGTEEKGTLIYHLDRTSTAMGARKLKGWMLYPLMDCTAIESRLDAVQEILSGDLIRDLPEHLKKIYDLERIASRIAMGTASARDLVGLRSSIREIPEMKSVIARTRHCFDGGDAAISKDTDGDCFVAHAPRNDIIGELLKSLNPLSDIAEKIERTIVDEPPISLRDGGLIKSSVNSELDELRSISSGGKDSIARIEARERERTGINSLKVKYNKIFGYYIEITNTHKDKVPTDYIRKQTLVNAERYITPELKDHEDKVLASEDRIRAIEYDIFSKLRDEIAAQVERISRTADAIATIDVLASFAIAASEYRYARPKVSDGGEIKIVEGRHPIIERLNPIERFVPNDIDLDSGENRLLMITGPNMAGKSTVMRQTALIVLMAQMGSFVPAKEANVGVVDRIFTRVGASDALTLGQSTFMVEMKEAATILKEATSRSLIVIDEIGRGTSTFDGLSIAWAVAEDIHDRVKARTLFATHYHELTELALTKPGIKNFNIAVKEWKGDIIFLRKLVPGGTSRSYGIQVAKLAGLPEAVISRSHEVLKNLETGEFDEIGKPRIAHHDNPQATTDQLNLFSRK